MELDKALSKQVSANASGYSSAVLTYKWNYAIAMQQAQLIAQKAHLPLSKNFEQAQALAKVGNVDYISGLDIGSLTKGVVYTNHELTDTHIDYILSVSVDQN
jgi:secreted PhoX family phosphatase